MLPENMRKQAADRLVNNIKRYKYHITTGFLGTPYICEVLTRYGYSNVAYRLLLQEDCPGWLYQVKMGATTIWERWDSIRKNGSIPNNGMNSLNHYAYGSIGDWLYRSAVGIREAAPGYKHIVIKPHTGGKFENMEASTITPYGKVLASWKAEENELKELIVEIPFNTTAEVFVPATSVEAVAVDDALVKACGMVDGYVKFAVGSGKYHFTLNINLNDYTPCLIHRKMFLEQVIQARGGKKGSRDLLMFALYSTVIWLFDNEDAQAYCEEWNGTFEEPLKESKLWEIFRDVDRKRYKFTVTKFLNLINATDEERSWYHKLSVKEERKKARHKAKEERNRKVKELRKQGLTIVAISKELHLSRPTIYKILNTE
jgi:hypothetical protein